MTWIERAECLGHRTDDFLDLEYPGRALSLCRRCEVVAECRMDAIATDDWSTIRGGMTPYQRHMWLHGRRTA